MSYEEEDTCIFSWTSWRRSNASSHNVAITTSFSVLNFSWSAVTYEEEDACMSEEEDVI